LLLARRDLRSEPEMIRLLDGVFRVAGVRDRGNGGCLADQLFEA
jgi:hypothetical protein